MLLQLHFREVRQVVPRQALPRSSHSGSAALAACMQCPAASCCASRVKHFGARGWCFVAPVHSVLLAANPRVRYILFAEDDCRLARDVSLEHLIESCRTACSLRKPAWLAFKQRRGKPNFGAHLLAFSRCSLNVFVKDAAAKDPCGTLALDTLLRALWQEGRVWTPRKSLAVQALHALKGRR